MVSIEHDADLLVTFGKETLKRLHEIDSLLLNLRKSGASYENNINQIFRDAHSIKSGANLLKLKQIELLAHAIEDILHILRDKKIIPNDSAIEIIMEGTDFVRQLINMIKLSNYANVESMLKRLKGLCLSLEKVRVNL
ncbi:MAG: Hpt domain-containing protein [Nitrospirae bacterium YQR-1]